MIKMQLEPALMGQVAREILETMFFASPEDAAEPNPCPADLLTAELKFEGALSGWFSIQVEENCARAIAGNFSGVMDPERAELRNHDRSSVRTRQHGVRRDFESTWIPMRFSTWVQPQLVSQASAGEGLNQWLSMDEGLIGLQLRWESQ